MIIIGARPSVGKTAFALNMALHHAIQDVSVIFSLEMSKKQLLKRAACICEEISSVKIRNLYRYFSEDDWIKYSNALRRIAGSQLHIFVNSQTKSKSSSPNSATVQLGRLS